MWVWTVKRVLWTQPRIISEVIKFSVFRTWSFNPWVLRRYLYNLRTVSCDQTKPFIILSVFPLILFSLNINIYNTCLELSLVFLVLIFLLLLLLLPSLQILLLIPYSDKTNRYIYLLLNISGNLFSSHLSFH